MQLFRLFFQFTALIAIPAFLSAQSSPELGESAQRDLRTTTNAIAVLTGDDSLAAGTYKFKNPVSPDVDVDLYKVNGEFPLADADSAFVPLVEISPAVLILKQTFNQSGINGSAEAESRGIGAGVGLKMQFFEKLLTLTPRLKVEYSEIDYDFSIEDVPDGLVDQIIPDISAWTYIPSLEASFRQQVSEDSLAAIFTTQLSYIYVDASTSGNTLADFSDDSWVWKNSIAFEQHFLLGTDATKVFIRPNIGRVDLYGAARNGFELNKFYEYGVDIASRDILNNLFSELGFGATYSYAKEFQGWRFGFFGAFS